MAATLTRRRLLGAAAGLSLMGCEDKAASEAIQGGFTGIDLVRGHQWRDAQRAGLTPARQQRTRVLIAGGGVAGLAAARALRLRGIDDFALLELEDSAGGNSRAGQLGGLACPLGAHYLPVPGDQAPEVQALLVELGLAQHSAGGWQLNATGERHLCHSPQERLFFQGQWQVGLLPVDGVGRDTLAQYRRFAQAVRRLQASAPFAMPMAKTALSPVHLELDALLFEAWLDRAGLTDPHLRWYLDYCCRDDYGAGLGTVSAWAGLHYFASRHGFHAPQDGVGNEVAEEVSERDQGVLTWPEGNAWLTQRLAAPLGERLRTGCSVLHITQGRHGVELDAFNHATQAVERWQAEACIVALPLFIAARVVERPALPLAQAAAQLRYAPWLVANLHLRAPLWDRPGAPPSWDNVIYREEARRTASAQAKLPYLSGLGYVDATHQQLSPVPGPTVLTHYRAFGVDPAQRQQLLAQPWAHWRDTVLADLSLPHPDLAALTTRIDITRYGHAMAVPTPGLLSLTRKMAFNALSGLKSSLSKQKQYQAMTPTDGRLLYAHSDWSAYSVFEEAFTRGHAAGASVGLG